MREYDTTPADRCPQCGHDFMVNLNKTCAGPCPMTRIAAQRWWLWAPRLGFIRGARTGGGAE